MPRYVLWTEEENLQIMVGFDEGLQGFFLTIATVDSNPTTPETYLFHNLLHHPGTSMTLLQLRSTLGRLGIALPASLEVQLDKDASLLGVPRTTISGKTKTDTPPPDTQKTSGRDPTPVRVLGWQVV